MITQHFQRTKNSSHSKIHSRWIVFTRVHPRNFLWVPASSTDFVPWDRSSPQVGGRNCVYFTTLLVTLSLCSYISQKELLLCPERHTSCLFPRKTSCGQPNLHIPYTCVGTMVGALVVSSAMVFIPPMRKPYVSLAWILRKFSRVSACWIFTWVQYCMSPSRPTNPIRHSSEHSLVPYMFSTSSESLSAKNK